MKRQHNITKKIGTSTLKVVTGAVLLVAANVSLHALEVRTSDQEVWGTRQIESGNIDEGIRILESHLRVPADRTSRAAYITNLCAAYILKGDFTMAKDYCDRGVQVRTSARDSYNNRAVMNALQGNLEAAAADLVRAGAKKTFEHSSVSSVAHRNLVRVQAVIAARNAKDDDLLADNASQ